ncbi:c-type cytochrome [Falsiroseomonas selenitidurans]|uniref:Cytochrome c n=1 Tax=Falsiroseomonas selenitidurans TaxID=2716335 RepID=A0ABX1E7F3_9PROT|nr:c-type cytochrome [Falsiroseomonas selenitidurans]NKC33149.1 cytochrome c [Falsiroseomonas selenitidurans]
MSVWLKAACAALVVAIVCAPPARAQDAALLERGRHLVEVTGACGNCHTPMGPQGPVAGRTLAGGTVFDEPPFRAVAPNITPDPETGIGRWTDAQLARAIREGIRPDGSLIGPPMPMALYRGLSDRDLAAIVAFLRTVPPVRNPVERSVYRITLPPAWGPPVTSVPEPANNPVARGEYLANAVAHCMECHTPMLPTGQNDHTRLGAGGMEFRGPWGVSVARNLTPHANGLGGWTDAQIIRAITQGISANDRPLAPPMAFWAYRAMTPAELSDLVAYLRSLKPQE